MNSFKKIALAVVAAMTLGTLSVAPASAAVMTVATTLDGAAKTATSSTAPVALPVPSDNKIDAADALKFVVTVDTGTTVSVSATNATIVTALHETAAPVTASSGSSSLTVATGTGVNATFYVYTKTTAIGVVTVTNQGTTFTYYVQGTPGLINTLSVSAPATGTAGTKQDISVTATDVFGNKVSGKELTATVWASSGTLDTATVSTGSGLADFGIATFKVTLPTTGFTKSLVAVTLKTAGDGASTVTGLTAPSLTPFVEIAIRDLAAELAKVQADLAAEKAARAADKTTADAAAATAKAAADAALATEKAAAATAKAAADAAAVKAAADLVTANAEIVKLKSDAITAKAAADKALADATAAHAAEIAKVKADNDAAMTAIKKAFNALAKKWNAKNPKAKVALVK